MRCNAILRKSDKLVLTIDDRAFIVVPVVGERTQSDVDALKAMARLADTESRRLLKQVVDDSNAASSSANSGP